MITCNVCGAQLSDESKFCNKCGTKVMPTIYVCTNCGKTLTSEDRFCGQCGFPVDQTNHNVVESQPEVSTKPIRPLVCELCGGNNLMKENGFFTCQHCGTKYSLEEARKMMIEGTVQITGTVKIDSSDKIENYLLMSNSAFNVKNYKEAEEYSNKAIEIDPQNSQAWYIKGKSAGWQSTLAKMRIQEAVQCWEKAIEYSDKADVDILKTEISIELFKLYQAIAGSMTEYFVIDPSHNSLDLVNIIDMNDKISQRLQIHHNKSKVCELVASNTNDAVMKAYNSHRNYYNSPPHERPTYDYDKWIRRMNYYFDLLVAAIDFSDNENTIQNLYSNAEYMQKAVIHSYSCTDRGQGLVKDRSLSFFDKSERRGKLNDLSIKRVAALERIGK